MSKVVVSEVRRLSIRLEMAEGRVQSLRQANTHDSYDLEQAMVERDGARVLFREALYQTTGCDPQTIARMLEV